MYTSRLLFVLSIVVVVASVAIGVQAQSVRPDRISFYNVPSQSDKYQSHIDYADGREARKNYGTCASGRVIEEQMNTYQATFVTEGCTPDIFQHLNLRWLGGCQFDFEDDPNVRITARGAYGEVTITGHYPQGAATLQLPQDTISMTAILSYTIAGILRTGNIGFDFSDPVGCVDAPATVTPTDTATTTATGTASPTAAPVLPAITPFSTETATPTMTPVETVSPTPTPTVAGACCPTGEDPEREPERMMFLPVVNK